LGLALFVLSIALPVAGVPLVAALGLSAAVTASVSGALLVSAELLGLAAVATMGKSGFAFIKGRVFGFLARHGPAAEVGRARYTVGLVMFGAPFLFGWLAPYVAELVPGVGHPTVAFALAGDAVLVASLFVLGGNFWDKLRALFVHDAEVRFR
jgi:hypothetical protein